VDWDVHHGDGT
jgi:histone deacetylase 6